MVGIVCKPSVHRTHVDVYYFDFASVRYRFSVGLYTCKFVLKHYHTHVISKHFHRFRWSYIGSISMYMNYISLLHSSFDVYDCRIERVSNLHRLIYNMLARFFCLFNNGCISACTSYRFLNDYTLTYTLSFMSIVHRCYMYSYRFHIDRV